MPLSLSCAFAAAAIVLAPTPSPKATPAPPSLLPRPPQFVVMAFDGAGLPDLFRDWRAVARKSHAHFTFFLSGVYLLEPEHKSVYTPPDRLAGHSAIGFLPVPKGEKPDDALRALLAEVDAALAEGHEIGTHFNGHWCGDGGIGAWDSDDWREEIDEFRRLVTDVNRNNDLVPPVTMTLTTAAIVGARTPCLEGDRRELDAALTSAGFRYDASRPGVRGEWPRREGGLWSFPVPPLHLPDAPHPVLAYDYNLYAHTLSGNPDMEDPEVKARSEKETYDALIAAFDESYFGSRAPFAVGSHFERWNHGAYTAAIGRFLEEVCLRPEVRCESFSGLADWLDAQPESDLKRLKHGDFEHLARRPAKSRASR